MPRQGGQGKGKPKLADRNFGVALIKSQNPALRKDRTNKSILSILDNNSLDDYILSTEMEDKESEVLRLNHNDTILVEHKEIKTVQSLYTGQYEHKHLKIPRRPKWSKSMTAEELDRLETEAFLKWRRELAMEEERNNALKLTPFEKNIDVWRQLWRVIERCDLLIQIADARNPLFYYSKDLKDYANNHTPPKPVVILVNKADFLTPYQRLCWAKKFDELKIPYIFYSAKYETDRINAQHEQMGTSTAPSSTQQKKVDDMEENPINTQPSHHIHNRNIKQTFMSIEEEEEEDDDDEDDSEESEDEREQEGIKQHNTSTVKDIINNKDVDGDKEEEEEEEKVEEEEEEEDISVVDNETTSDDDDDNDKKEEAHECVQHSSLQKDVLGGSSGNNEIDITTIIQEITTLLIHPQDYTTTTIISSSSKTSTPSSRLSILNRESLILFFEELSEALHLTPHSQTGHICIGMVGYPNVGKSSVMNTLLEVAKHSHGHRVSVSSTPGRTKHLQTFILTDSLMLCDCPGLVFPSFMNTTGDMLLSGVLPINNMKQYIEPAASIACRIPQHIFEAVYGMKIKRELDIFDAVDRPPTAFEMLAGYCAVRGYITNGTGRWDEFRGTKELLRDFNEGRLLYITPPEIPDIDLIRWNSETEQTIMRNEKVRSRLDKIQLKAAAVSLVNAEDDNEKMLLDLLEAEEDAEDEEQSVNQSIHTDSNGDRKLKREHKRLKTWGKKGRKLRDKDPYGEGKGPEAFLAHFKNRSAHSMKVI